MKTQTDRLLTELLLPHRVHDGLTGMEIITHLGILNYKGRIHDVRRLLRKRHNFPYEIETKMVAVSNRWGEKCRVAQYRLVRQAEESKS